VLVVVVVIFVILVAIGVHSCQVSSDQSALKDYNNSVSSLITRSDETSASLFKDLSNTGGATNGINLQTQINQTRVTASGIVTDAHQLSAPDSVKTANANLLSALQMRLDGIAGIARDIQAAVAATPSQSAITDIAAQMARFYASDVLYKDYTVPAIVSALHANGIGVGGTNGETINAGQFVPNVQWVLPTFIEAKLTGTPVSSTGKVAPGLHGHSLNSVSVGGTTLQTGSPNTIPAKPAPTFKLNITNGGNFNEYHVVCKVSVSGTSDSGQTVVPQTDPNQTTDVSVTLASAPAPGTYTIVANVAKVPGEKNLKNNTLSYTVTFQ